MKKIICWSFLFCILFCACGKDRGSSSSSYFSSCGYAATEEVKVQEASYDEVAVTVEEPQDNILYGTHEEDLAGDISASAITEGNNKFVSSFIKKEDTSSTKKKIIKDGSLTIKTNDIEVAKKRIDKLVKSVDGYYSFEHLYKYDDRVSYTLAIRVPANNFEKLFSSVEKGSDEVERKSIDTRDVTEEYIDVTARLANKREYLKQYIVLLSRANSVKDILEIKENIRKLQEEIESAEGRLRFLNHNITFSFLAIELYQQVDYVYKPKPKDSFFERVKSSVSTGWDMIVNFVLFLISIWSVLLVLILAFFFIRRKIKKRKQRKNS